MKSPAAVATVVSITSTHPVPISVSTISPNAITTVSVHRGSTDATVRATDYSNLLNV